MMCFSRKRLTTFWGITAVAPILIALILTACGSDPTPPPTPTVVLPATIPVTEPAPPPTAMPPMQPEHINFAPDKTSTTVSGLINGNESRQYVLQALAGQTVIVFPNAGSSDIKVTIAGQDNTVPEQVVNGNMLTAVLPHAQDYFLTLTTQAGAVNVNYTMTVLVIGAMPPSGPERLTFTTGSTVTSVNGTLTDNGNKTYVTRAEAGQSMFIDTTPSGSGVTISIRGADGAMLGWVPAGTQFSAILPTTQDYFIDLVAPADTSAIEYEMTVTIQ